MSADSAILARIAAADPVHADTMRNQPTSFESERLPFYKKFALVKAQIDLPHRPLQFRYADDGSRAIYLSGAAEDVYRANDAEGLDLGESQVPSYVRFFLSVTGGGERALVERPADVAWLPATEKDPALKRAREAASSKIRPPAASKTGAGYRVTATVLEGNRLLELTLDVTRNGRVTVASSRVLAENLPVPATL